MCTECNSEFVCPYCRTELKLYEVCKCQSSKAPIPLLLEDPLTVLYKDLNSKRWQGASEGWNKAIKSVSLHIKGLIDGRDKERI